MRVPSSTKFNHSNPKLQLPVLIDMALYPAFIKSNSCLFVLHRFQERQRLAFTHLALFFQFRLGNLRTFVCRLLWLLLSCAFHFTGEFFLRWLRGRSGWFRAFTFTFSFSRRGGGHFTFALAWRGRFIFTFGWAGGFIFAFAWAGRFFGLSYSW